MREVLLQLVSGGSDCFKPEFSHRNFGPVEGIGMLTECGEADLSAGATMNHQRACQILGVPTDASTETIRLSYHQLVRVWHPDRFTDDEALKDRAEWQLREINAAYDVCLRGAPEAESVVELETPWYPPPSESVVRSTHGGYSGFHSRPSEEGRPDYNMIGLLALVVFFTIGAAMILLAT